MLWLNLESINSEQFLVISSHIGRFYPTERAYSEMKKKTTVNKQNLQPQPTKAENERV